MVAPVMIYLGYSSSWGFKILEIKLGDSREFSQYYFFLPTSFPIVIYYIITIQLFKNGSSFVLKWAALMLYQSDWLCGRIAKYQCQKWTIHDIFLTSLVARLILISLLQKLIIVATCALIYYWQISVIFVSWLRCETHQLW